MSLHKIAKQINAIQTDNEYIMGLREKMIYWLIYEPHLVYVYLPRFNNDLVKNGLEKIEV